MKIKIKTLFRDAAGLFLLAFLLPAQAAPLNLPFLTAEPLINSNGTFVDYVYTAGTGGVLNITGLTTNAAGTFGGGQAELNGASYRETSSQVIRMPGTIPDAQISANIGGSGAIVSQTPYLLTATFDTAGVFTGGSVRVDGYAVSVGCFGTCTSVHSSFLGTNSGTILTMSLTNFGFSGTPTGSGTDDIVLEWVGAITGGDLFDIGFTGTGGVVGLGDVNWNGGSFGGAWDPTNSGDTSAFLQSFSSCAGCNWDQNTFVPVPAAVWLFGSGLLGLFGVSVRRRK